MSERDFENLMHRMKTRREELGLSYQDLAEKMGMSKSSLQRYETGNIKNFPVGKLPDLARALETTPSELTGWGIEEQTNSTRDLLDGELFAAYGEVKESFSESDLEEIRLFMRMKAEMKRKKAQEGK